MDSNHQTEMLMKIGPHKRVELLPKKDSSGSQMLMCQDCGVIVHNYWFYMKGAKSSLARTPCHIVCNQWQDNHTGMLVGSINQETRTEKNRYWLWTSTTGEVDIPENSPLLKLDTGPERVVAAIRPGRQRILVIDGEMLTAQEWADRVGIPKDVILSRLFKGLPDREAVFRPWRPRQRRLKRKFFGTGYHTQEQVTRSFLTR